MRDQAAYEGMGDDALQDFLGVETATRPEDPVDLRQNPAPGVVECGLYRALGRIGPDVVSHCPDALDVVSKAARSHPDARTRAAAAEALAAFRPSAARP